MNRVAIAMCTLAFACGDDASPADTEAASSTGPGSSTTAPMDGGATDMGDTELATTGPMPCVIDAECTEATAPFCESDSGQCVGCDGVADPDGACLELDANTPLCVDGACVACTPETPIVCEDQRLLCDGETNTCVPCTAHEQCGSGACELAMGRCFPEDFVVTVDGDGGADYTSVAAAVGDVDDGMTGVIVVHEQDMAAPYLGVVVGGGKTIALLAAPGEAPIIQGTGGNPGLRVETAGTILYMDGLEVSLAAMSGQGLIVDGAYAWLDRSRIVQNSGGGIVASNGAELTVRNCFVGGGVDVVGIEVDGSSANLLYSTVTASTFGMTPAFSCMSPMTVNVRNSIIVSQGGTSPDEFSCAGAMLTDSVTEAEVGAFTPGWFQDFNGGDFHLTPMAPVAIATTARWQAGDPPTDIDGDPRPSTEGAMDYAGADAVP